MLVQGFKVFFRGVLKVQETPAMHEMKVFGSIDCFDYDETTHGYSEYEYG